MINKNETPEMKWIDEPIVFLALLSSYKYKAVE